MGTVWVVGVSEREGQPASERSKAQARHLYRMQNNTMLDCTIHQGAALEDIMGNFRRKLIANEIFRPVPPLATPRVIRGALANLSGSTTAEDPPRLAGCP